MAREHPGPVAIVTGGASGIGRALAAALVGRGGTVVVADLEGEAAERVAEELRRRGPGHAEAVRLDVRDAAAVAAAYTRVRDEHGRLDLVFNNAGVAVGGLADELTLDHWNRAIDVNLRGVVHGVQAAYPLLLDQGFGHIVNTASLAGLFPAPLMVPYTATKHAVVGLSLALRAEAASRGVRVSVVCPGFVDTPLLDRVNSGLPDTLASRRTRQQVRRVQPRLYSADRLAQDVLRGVARNRAIIVAPASARLAARLTRLAPAAAVTAAGVQVRRYLRERAAAWSTATRLGG